MESLRSATLFALAQRQEMAPDQHFAITGPPNAPLRPARRTWSWNRVSRFALDAEAVPLFAPGAPAIGDLASGIGTQFIPSNEFLLFTICY
jgi:hypothetical protein